MKKYRQLLKLIYLTIKVWQAYEKQEEQKCEYCDQVVFNNNICSFCKREQPQFKLNLTFVDKMGHYIEAWDKKLAEI